MSEIPVKVIGQIGEATYFEAPPEFARQMDEAALLGWSIQDPRFYARVLGSWQETPREELKRRLNNWLRGTYPGEPINWKGLS
jgi:hypothetical protein